ncbi:MAG: glucose-6-phosphate isomerase [Chloroflexi bacterium]|nr:glucose-6-phosphate isomerase [Chloroflexota bacterium]|tara:strand:+ start:932 stop:1939 length:1008 start_codon:yes stop_codon:yes gene_type:complete
MDIQEIQKFDPQKMYQVYDKWPTLAKDAYEKEFTKMKFGNIDHVVLAGMGGSGAIGDIIAAILSRENFHVSTVKGYLLPKTVDDKTLVIAISISGNTKETLAILDYKSESNAKFIAISSGGVMRKKCLENSIPHYNIKMNHSPRASFGIFLYSILNILEDALPIQKSEVIESIEKMKELQKNINSNNLNEKNLSLSLAKDIDSNPLIYYPDGLKAAAIRFKNSLQENSKIHTSIEDVIEASHNSISTWENNNNFKPILLQGANDYIKTKQRWQIIKDYFKSKNIEYAEVFSVDGNIISKLVCLIYLLDYTSIYLAILSKIDPSPVDAIDFVKSRL